MDLLSVMMGGGFGLSWLIIRFDDNCFKIASRMDNIVGDDIFIINIVSNVNIMGFWFIVFKI